MPERITSDHHAVARVVATMAAGTVFGDADSDEASREQMLEVVAVSSTILEAARSAMESSVAAARRRGCTWAEIGSVLGVTRQAAFRRYGRRPPPT
jgi:CRP-like cAMP-binding protein